MGCLLHSYNDFIRRQIFKWLSIKKIYFFKIRTHKKLKIIICIFISIIGSAVNHILNIYSTFSTCINMMCNDELGLTSNYFKSLELLPNRVLSGITLMGSATTHCAHVRTRDLGYFDVSII